MFYGNQSDVSEFLNYIYVLNMIPSCKVGLTNRTIVKMVEMKPLLVL